MWHAPAPGPDFWWRWPHCGLLTGNDDPYTFRTEVLPQAQGNHECVSSHCLPEAQRLTYPKPTKYLLQSVESLSYSSGPQSPVSWFLSVRCPEQRQYLQKIWTSVSSTGGLHSPTHPDLCIPPLSMHPCFLPVPPGKSSKRTCNPGIGKPSHIPGESGLDHLQHRVVRTLDLHCEFGI